MSANNPGTVLGEAESWALARVAVVGRLAISGDGCPDIFPVNYFVDRDTVVFRTAAGTKLAGVVGSRVAFEVDGHDAATGDAWSVVIKGRGHELLDLFQMLDALDLPLDTWHAAPDSRFVRITPDAVTGRRFSRRNWRAHGTNASGPSSAAVQT